ncbi:MAG: hypothetical protein Q9207_005482 [Kuettlingeria erythrocarpa]
MHSCVQFITTPTADTDGTAILLDAGKKRYLFGNIHEGLQRACIQRNVRLAKTTDIFITGRTEWKNVGGLFGIILNLADANASAIQSAKEQAEKKAKANTEDTSRLADARARKKAKDEDGRAEVFREAGLDPQEWLGGPEDSTDATKTSSNLTVHGGKNLTHTIATARRFIFRHNMSVDFEEHVQTDRSSSVGDGRDPDWKDETIQVWKLPIDPTNCDRSPTSLRKRSFDEYSVELTLPPQQEDGPPKASPIPLDSEAQFDEQRRSVVARMLNSTPSVDALTEMPLVRAPKGVPVWVRNEATKKLERYSRPEDGTIPQINVFIRRPWPGARVEHLPPTKPSQTATSYIVRLHPQRGKFQPEKARSLNVHCLVYRALQHGVTVKSRDGATVTPDMVLAPSRPGGGFAMVDLPSADYITELLSRPEWKMPRIMDGLQAIIWNLGPDVATNPSLRTFFHQHRTIKHVVTAPDMSPNNITFDSSTALTVRLNQIDSKRYPIPYYDNRSYSNPQSVDRNDASYSTPHIATRGFQLQLEPSLQVQMDRSQSNEFFDTETLLKSTPKEVLEHAQRARDDIESEKLEEDLFSHDLPSGDAEIICLGTGSSNPSKYRNVSATLLRVPGSGSYLFDCGEGTLGQLRRLYTASEMEELFWDLKAIWISHLHADHHLGTASVIKAWSEATHGTDTVQVNEEHSEGHSSDPIQSLQRKKVLFLFSESQMIQWLKEYSSVEDFGYDRLVAIRTYPEHVFKGYTKMEWGNIPVGFNTKDAPMNDFMQEKTGITNLVTCRVSHCLGAQAVSVTFPTGFKFSYSGDCRPSKYFVDIGRGSTVLVHEATFDDEMQGDAEAKRHSTMGEAIGVAQAMDAQRLVLTHFSQRYQKIAQIAAPDDSNVKYEDVEAASEGEGDNGMAEDLDPLGSAINFGHHASPPRAPNKTSPFRNRYIKNDLKVAIAFDFLRVRVGEIAYLEQLTPVLQEMFKILEKDGKAKTKDDHDELAQKTKEGKAAISDGRTELDTNAEKKEEREACKRQLGEGSDRSGYRSGEDEVSRQATATHG